MEVLDSQTGIPTGSEKRNRKFRRGHGGVEHLRNFWRQSGGGGVKGFFLPRVRFQEYFCPKQDHGLKPLAAPLYPDMGQVSTHHLPTGSQKRANTLLPKAVLCTFTSILWTPGLGSSSIASEKRFDRQTIYKLKLKSSVKVKLESYQTNSKHAEKIEDSEQTLKSRQRFERKIQRWSNLIDCVDGSWDSWFGFRRHFVSFLWV